MDYNQFAAASKANERRRALAMAIAQQGMQPQNTPKLGTIASPMSPLQPLAGALQSYLGAQGMQRADESDLTLEQQRAAARAAEVGALSSAPDNATLRRALSGALASSDPTIRELAKTRLASMDKTRETYASTFKDMAAPVDLRNALASEDFGGMSFRKPPEPRMETFGDQPVAITENLKGEKKVTPLRVGTNVSVNTGSRADLAIESAQIDQIKQGREALQAAPSTIANAVRAVDLLNKGADAGGGASARQAVRKFGQAFGVEIPETGLTEALRMRLGDNILAEARKLAPVTGNDVVLLQQLIGSIDTDPQALREVSALMIAKTLATADRHNAFVQQVAGQSSASNPKKYDSFKVDLAGANVKDPELLARVYQLMKEGGLDMSRYTYDGKPVSEIDLNVDYMRTSPAKQQKNQNMVPPPGRIQLK